MVRRTYLIKKAERLLRARKVLGRQPAAIGRLLTPETRAALQDEGIAAPKGQDEGVWNEWGKKTCRKIGEWRKAQHAKRRKMKAESMSKHEAQIEKQRKKALKWMPYGALHDMASTLITKRICSVWQT